MKIGCYEAYRSKVPRGAIRIGLPARQEMESTVHVEGRGLRNSISIAKETNSAMKVTQGSALWNMKDEGMPEEA